MSETNRRRICRLLFLALAMFPCIALLAAAVWRKSSWDEQSWRTALRREFGVDVAWDAIAYPAPGVVRWENLRFHDQDAGALLAAIDACAMTDQHGRVRFAPHIIEVSAPRAASLTESLRRCFIHSDQGLDVAECELHLLDAENRIAARWNIPRAECWRTDAGQKCVVRCQLEAGAEVALHLERDAASGAWQLTLDTQNRPLRLASLEPLLPRLAALGSAATFQGAIQLMPQSDGWNAQLHGLVNHIDLAALINPHTKQHLTGNAAVQIKSARFENGKLASASGLFGAAEGEIGLGLVSELSGGFFFGSTIPLERRLEVIPYGELKAHFDIHDGALTLVGLCEPGKALLVDDQGVAILKPTKQLRSRPLVAALQLLYTSDGPKVTASRESLWLANYLPAPNASDMPDYMPATTKNAPPASAADRVTQRPNALRSRPHE